MTDRASEALSVAVVVVLLGAASWWGGVIAAEIGGAL